MDVSEFYSWLSEVDAMIDRMERLCEAIDRGYPANSPDYAIENREVREVDLAGLNLLRRYYGNPVNIFPWYVHTETECTPLSYSLSRLRRNRNVIISFTQRRSHW